MEMLFLPLPRFQEAAALLCAPTLAGFFGSWSPWAGCPTGLYVGLSPRSSRGVPGVSSWVLSQKANSRRVKVPAAGLRDSSHRSPSRGTSTLSIFQPCLGKGGGNEWGSTVAIIRSCCIAPGLPTGLVLQILELRSPGATLQRPPGLCGLSGCLQPNLLSLTSLSSHPEPILAVGFASPVPGGAAPNLPQGLPPPWYLQKPAPAGCPPPCFLRTPAAPASKEQEKEKRGSGEILGGAAAAPGGAQSWLNPVEGTHSTSGDRLQLLQSPPQKFKGQQGSLPRPPVSPRPPSSYFFFLSFF